MVGVCFVVSVFFFFFWRGGGAAKPLLTHRVSATHRVQTECQACYEECHEKEMNGIWEVPNTRGLSVVALVRRMLKNMFFVFPVVSVVVV